MPRQKILTETKVEQGKEMIEQGKPKNLRISPPPFPKRLTLPRPIVSLDFDILGALRKLHIKIPILRAI